MEAGENGKMQMRKEKFERERRCVGKIKTVRKKGQDDFVMLFV